jgi:hypothetical protein
MESSQMICSRRRFLIAAVLGLLAPSEGCGPRGDNEAVFSGGGGRPAEGEPATPAEYDLKYQAGPAAVPRKKSK